MRAAPFFLIILILAGGVALAFQNLNSPEDATAAPTERATVTPRPRPTSPPRPTSGIPTATLIPTQAPTPSPEQPTPTQAAQTPTAAPTAQAAASPTAGQPTPGATPQAVLKVGNTDRQGVYLRRTPRLDDRIRPWIDGTPMVVVGPQVEGDGQTWQHVRAPDGAEGYVPAQFLVAS